MHTDHDIEQALRDAGKTAPRITPQHIESVIASEHYFTAKDGVTGKSINRHSDDWADQPESLALLTFCVLVLRNGFTVTGESACASPENFIEKIGREVARKNAIDKIWMLEGYALKERLNLSAYPERKR